jgi:NAD(P)-dependent dehydrogenase (short-subunit alcohol dehydrogenase family)
MAKLAGKNAIVTGAAGGIGAATARLFLEEGANVTFVDLDQQALDDVARSFDPSRVLTIAADVSLPDDADRYVNEAVKRFGRLDVLFANAGIGGACVR